jgi:uncharacterized integral membrane protein
MGGMTSPLPPEDASTEPAGTRPEPGAVRPESPAAERPETPAAGLDRHGRVKRTRASGLWVGLITAAVLAIGFLVFIVQNYEKVSIEFLGFEGRLSLAIALLLSAIIGALVVAVPGAADRCGRRRALRKNAKH